MPWFQFYPSRGGVIALSGLGVGAQVQPDQQRVVIGGAEGGGGVSVVGFELG